MYQSVRMRVSVTVAVLAAILLVPVNSKVGTVKGNGTSAVFVEGESHSRQNEEAVSWWLILVIVLCCLCALLCAVFCYFKKCQLGRRDFVPVKTEATVVCHLCLEKISCTEWDSGRHRAKCQEDNTYFLKSLSQAKNIHCPDCGDRMRQWLKMGPGFTCNDQTCLRSNFLLINNGKNRFNCFICDNDFCGDCVNKKIQRDEAKPIYCVKQTDESHNQSQQMINRIESEEAISESLLAPNENMLHQNDVVNNNAVRDITDTSNNSLNNSTPSSTHLQNVHPYNSHINISNPDTEITKSRASATLPHKLNPQNPTQSDEKEVRGSLPYKVNLNDTPLDKKSARGSLPYNIQLNENSSDKKSSRGSLPYNVHLNDSYTYGGPPAIPWATHPTLDSKESQPESFFA